MVIYPLQQLVNIPVSLGLWVTGSFTDRADLLKENTNLRMQQTILKTQLQKFSAIEAENLRLRELLQSSQRVKEKVLIGEIIAVDLDPFTRQIVINKGSNFGVFNGQPILDADGVMGQVIHVGPFSSTAMLITDPSHATPVELNRNGYRAIAIGTGGTSILELTNIPNSADIVIDDLLVTSGLGGRFPPGYPVGRISEVDTDVSRSYAKVVVTPSANLDRGREVLLVWSADKKNESEEEPGVSDAEDTLKNAEGSLPSSLSNDAEGSLSNDAEGSVSNTATVEAVAAEVSVAEVPVSESVSENRDIESNATNVEPDQ